MDRFVKKEIIYFFYFIFALLLSNCANQLPPGGGAVDLVPPKIENVFPQNGTTNFNKNYIEINFSKFINKLSLPNSIFISPSIDGPFDYDWTNKSVKISFSSKLKQNVTYIVTIGTQLEDYNNHNKMSEAYTFAFSTGNKIDNGVISGKVFSSKPGGISIFAYMIGDSSINPSVQKPNYISQTGEDGKYKLLGLANGIYRVFAVQDESKSFLYNPENDEIGNPQGDVTISKIDSIYTDLNFFMTKYDTVKPRLVKAIMTDAFHVLLVFNKDIDSESINLSNFSLVDSTANKTIKPEYVFKSFSKGTDVILSGNFKIPVKDEVFVFTKSIKAKSGIEYKSDFINLNVSDKPDTTKPIIVYTSPSNGASNVDFVKPKFLFYFNDSFDTVVASKGIAFTDTSGKFILSKIHFIDDASFSISPLVNLKPNNDYMIKIDLSKFSDLNGNKYDSVYQYKFRTINGLDFTGVSGKVINAEQNLNPYLVLESSMEPKTIYKQHLKKNNVFEFDRIQPGKYTLWCFYDSDSSKTYSYGTTFPFHPAEKFWVYPDTLNLRPRWTITDVQFILKK
jgi:archaellin